MKLGFTPNAISNSSFSLPLLFTRPPSHPFSAQSSSTKITSSDSGVCMYPYISTPVPSPSFDFFLKIFINGSLFNFCWMLCFGQLDSSFLFCVLKPDTDSWLFMMIAVQILYSLDIAGFSICFCDFFFSRLGFAESCVLFMMLCREKELNFACAKYSPDKWADTQQLFDGFRAGFSGIQQKSLPTYRAV